MTYLLDKHGTVLAHHRKAQLFGELDRAFFTAGVAPTAVGQFGELRIGLLICYDVEFPEGARAAAQQGAHLIAVPTAQMEPFAYVAEGLIRTRAWENQVYVAYANHSGAEGEVEYVGRSSIVAPSAAVLDAAGTDAAIVRAEIDTDVVAQAQRANPYLSDLRPDLYIHQPLGGVHE